MDTGVGGFARGVQAGDGSVSPEIGFHPTHHVVSGGADGGHVGGEIEAVAEAGGVDARETLLEKFGGFVGHVEIHVFGLCAMHFGDDGAGDDIARGEFLGFGVTLHEAFEQNVAEDAAFAAKSFGKKKARRAFDCEGGGMELHELHVGEDGAGFVGDGQAVAGGDFWIGGFAIDLTEAAGREEYGAGTEFVERAIGFVDEADADGAAVFEDEAGGERVGAQVEMGNGVRAGEKSAADFAAGGIAVGVEDAGAAVSGFAGEGELGAGAIEFGAPFDELGDVLGTFFDEESDCFGAAKAVTGVESVLLVKADFVFVAECDGNTALRPGRGGIAEIGFGEDQDTARGAEFDGGAQTGNAGADDGIVSLIGLCGGSHGESLRGWKYGSRF